MFRGFAVVCRKERRSAKCPAPFWVRMVPDIFCRILVIRIFCSAALFENGIAVSWANFR